MKSYVAKQEEVVRDWYIVDASGHTAGRLGVEIARVLRGKTKPTYTPHVDSGDFVVVINAEKVVLTGRKEEQKIYKHYTGWASGLKEYKAKRVRARNPERIIYDAVKGMLPKTKLAARMITRLKVYAGEEHPHGAQQPKDFTQLMSKKPKSLVSAPSDSGAKKDAPANDAGADKAAAEKAAAEAAAKAKAEKEAAAEKAAAAAKSAVPEGAEVDAKRGVIYKTKPSEVDDLTKISGVGPVLEEKLNEAGIYTYQQIANWAPEAVAEFDELLSFPGRIERDEWLTKAAELHKEKYDA